MALKAAFSRAGFWCFCFCTSGKRPSESNPHLFCPSRFVALALALILAAPLFSVDRKLTFDERVELMRGLMAEYATAKTLIPRSKKNLEVETSGAFNKPGWDATSKEFGPAARVGDMVQITKVDIESDRIVLQLNGGFNGGRHWYQGVQVGMGGSTSPISTNQNSAAPGGTTIELLFHKPLTPMKAAEVKKMLAPVLDFEKHSATEAYAENLPPEIKQAIREKRVRIGMDRDQVLLALGHPDKKLRETKDGLDTEDWIFGTPPGKIVFVTFSGDKVIKVKEDYAGLGGSQASTPAPPI